jgi:hypothetical protein
MSSKDSDSSLHKHNAGPSMPKKKKVHEGKCKFNNKWLANPNFRDWLAVHDSPNNTRCTVCSTVFSIRFDAEKAVDMCAMRKKHMSLLAAKTLTCMLHAPFKKAFFF